MNLIKRIHLIFKFKEVLSKLFNNHQDINDKCDLISSKDNLSKILFRNYQEIQDSIGEGEGYGDFTTFVKPGTLPAGLEPIIRSGSKGRPGQTQ